MDRIIYVYAKHGQFWLRSYCSMATMQTAEGMAAEYRAKYGDARIAVFDRESDALASIPMDSVPANGWADTYAPFVGSPAK